jgi:hypothetical protein
MMKTPDERRDYLLCHVRVKTIACGPAIGRWTDQDGEGEEMFGVHGKQENVFEGDT